MFAGLPNQSPQLTMVFQNFDSKKLKPSQLFNLKIDGVNIKQVFNVNYLGVTFNSSLTWKNHINELDLF